MDLDHVDAVLDLRPDDVPHLVGAVGDPVVALLGEHRYAHLRGEVVHVAVAARHRDARPAGDDPGADQETLADRSPQVDGQKRLSPEVADRGEARLDGGLGVLDRGEGTVERGVLEPVDLVVAVGARGDVRVAVDQAGQDPDARQVDDIGAVGDRDFRGRAHALDPLALDQDHLIGAERIAGAVEQAAGLDDRRCRGGGRGLGPGWGVDGFEQEGDGEDDERTRHGRAPVQSTGTLVQEGADLNWVVL